LVYKANDRYQWMGYRILKMDAKIFVFQNNVENFMIKLSEDLGLSYLEVIASLDSVSNTFRKMYLTKLAYDSVTKERELKEESNDNEGNNSI